MTPKEKAREIVRNMYDHTGWLAETKEGFDNQDISCALICVNELIIESRSLLIGRVLYWEEVKKEIIKLTPS